MKDYAELEKRLRKTAQRFLEDASYGAKLDEVRYEAPFDSFLVEVADAISDLTKRLEESPRWQLMEKRPDDMDCFLAAVEVHNRRTGKTSWDIHLVTLDDETGEINEDTGWTLEDYTWFAPRPSPPTGIGDPNLLSREPSK